MDSLPFSSLALHFSSHPIPSLPFPALPFSSVPSFPFLPFPAFPSILLSSLPFPFLSFPSALFSSLPYPLFLSFLPLLTSWLYPTRTASTKPATTPATAQTPILAPLEIRSAKDRRRNTQWAKCFFSSSSWSDSHLHTSRNNVTRDTRSNIQLCSIIHIDTSMS